MKYTRDLPEGATQDVVDDVIAHVRAELSARADADDDPETNADDVTVRVERQEGHVRVIGELAMEPNAPYLQADFDPYEGVPAELREHARNDEV